MASISVYYQRPGKGLTIYEEDLVQEDEVCLRTFKSLPDESGERLSVALRKQGLIRADQSVRAISKVYFFAEPFNILEFQDAAGNLLGYYSDIGEPARKLAPGKYEMTDLYLDVWLSPEGQLLELDWDEFEEALQKKIINTEQANLARAAMQRIKAENTLNIYPDQYIRVSK